MRYINFFPWPDEQLNYLSLTSVKYTDKINRWNSINRIELFQWSLWALHYSVNVSRTASFRILFIPVLPYFQARRVFYGFIRVPVFLILLHACKVYRPSFAHHSPQFPALSEARNSFRCFATVKIKLPDYESEVLCCILPTFPSRRGKYKSFCSYSILVIFAGAPSSKRSSPYEATPRKLLQHRVVGIQCKNRSCHSKIEIFCIRAVDCKSNIDWTVSLYIQSILWRRLAAEFGFPCDQSVIFAFCIAFDQRICEFIIMTG